MVRAFVSSITRLLRGWRARARIRRIHLQQQKTMTTYRWLPSRRINGNPSYSWRRFVNKNRHPNIPTHFAKWLSFRITEFIEPIWRYPTWNESFQWLHVLWPHHKLLARRKIPIFHSSLANLLLWGTFIVCILHTVSLTRALWTTGQMLCEVNVGGGWRMRQTIFVVCSKFTSNLNGARKIRREWETSTNTLSGPIKFSLLPKLMDSRNEWCLSSHALAHNVMDRSMFWWFSFGMRIN